MVGQGYNFGSKKAALLRKNLEHYRRMNESHRWTPEKELELADLVADGHGWDVCGMALGCSARDCELRFERIKRLYGE